MDLGELNIMTMTRMNKNNAGLAIKKDRKAEKYVNRCK
jgi:hypothetical protein